MYVELKNINAQSISETFSSFLSLATGTTRNTPTLTFEGNDNCCSSCQILTMIPRFIRRIVRWLININLLHDVASLEPWKAFLLAFGVGLGLAVWSSIVGVNFFWVKINIQHLAGIEEQRLRLGFLDQVNYGLWYLVFCPFLFMLISTAYRSTALIGVRSSKFIMPFEKLRYDWKLALLGLLLLFMFVGKNVWVERQDYKNLGLGWVQAPTLEGYRTQIEKTGPVDLTAAGKKFDQFLLIKKKEYIPEENIQRVLLVEVDPNLHITNFWAMVAFVIATKIWVGFWEALVVYMSGLTLVWGSYALARIDPKSAISTDKRKYGVAWFFVPGFYLICIGILVHLFCIFRFCGNAIKGSYGKWDQYWSLLTMSPALVVIVVGTLILSKIHMFPQLESQTYFTKNMLFVVGLWVSSLIYILYLLLGYIHPQDQEVLVMCFRPFTAVLEKLFG